MRGLPIELLRVFLSEVNIKAGVYAKAALTAQAYAQLVVTGTAIAQPTKNIKPGFNIVAGAGVGLKAGAGFRVFAAMEIDDFSRFVARSVDVLVEKTCDELKDNLPSDSVVPRILLDAARPLFKTVLRTSYELGEYLALNAPAATASGAQEVALRCAQVALEEPYYEKSHFNHYCCFNRCHHPGAKTQARPQTGKGHYLHPENDSQHSHESNH